MQNTINPLFIFLPYDTSNQVFVRGYAPQKILSKSGDVRKRLKTGVIS